MMHVMSRALKGRRVASCCLSLIYFAACASVEDRGTVINGDISLDFGIGGESNPDGERPILTRIGWREISVGEELIIQLEAESPTGGELFFEVLTRMPEGATLDPEIGLFKWLPSEEYANQEVLVTFQVSDGVGSARESIRVTVLPEGVSSQQPPVVDPVGDHVLTVGVEWKYQVIATDPNGDALTFSLERLEASEGAPSEGLTLSESGELRWISTEAELGSHQIKVIVADETGQTEVSSTLIVVRPGEEGSNTPPQWVEPETSDLIVEEPFSLQLEASDPEGEMLIFSVEGELPMGATLSSEGLFAWTPPSSFSNQSVLIQLKVSDGVLSAYTTLTLNITPPQRDCSRMTEGRVGETQPIRLGHTIEARLLCNAGDIDLYEFQLDQASRVEVSAIFTDDLGDIDVKLLTSSLELIGQGITTTDDELIRSYRLDPGTYLIEVKLYLMGPVSYDLSYRLIPDDPMCVADDLEGANDNNQRERAVPLPIARRQAANICPGDRDVYLLEGQRGQPFTISATCAAPCNQDHLSQLKAELIGPQHDQPHDENWVDITNSAGGISIESVIPTTGTYYLTLSPQKDYDLSFPYEVTAQLLSIPNCTPDQFDQGNGNDRPSAAADITLGTVRRGLTACEDPNDWYQVTLPSNANGITVLIGYDDASGDQPKVETTDAGNQRVNVTTMNGTTTECGTQRSRCRKANVGRSSAGETIRFAVYASKPPWSYDLKVITSQ